MRIFWDQTGRRIEIPDKLQRIVSLVPSQTELLFDLGLDQEIIGITKFCIHPKGWYSTKKRIGGTKTVNEDLIKSLAPDLVIANMEENVKDQIERIGRHCPVWTSRVLHFQDALDMIDEIGKMTGTETKSEILRQEILITFQKLIPFQPPRRVVYLIWKDPLMTIGSDTFIHDILKKCGWLNCFEDLDRYPVISQEELQSANAQYLFLSSEPFPFQRKHIEYFKNLLPDTRIVLVNGEMFSWYGSRLLRAGPYLRNLSEQLGGE